LEGQESRNPPEGNSVPIGNYRFRFQVNASGDYYEPAELTVSREGLRTLVEAQGLLQGRRRAGGSLRVEFQETPMGLSWRAEAQGPSQIEGLRFSVSGLPLGQVIVPTAGGTVFTPDEEVSLSVGTLAGDGRPLWCAAFLVVETLGQVLYLHGEEYPPRVRRLWAKKMGESLAVDLYCEENAWQRSSRFASPKWAIDRVKDWREAVAKYRAWMEEAYGLQPFERRPDVPPWMRRIALYLNIYAHSYTNRLHYTFAEIEAKLRELATCFPAGNMLVYIAGWDGRTDTTYPDYAVSREAGGEEGLRRLVATAHSLGYRVMLHMNLFGVSYRSPLYPRFEKEQIRDSEGRRMGWTADYNRDGVREEHFAYISPDAAEWRRYLIEKAKGVVQSFGVDAVHLDQTGLCPNDPNHDTYRGQLELFRELKAALPGVLFEGEGMTEQAAPLTPVYHMWITAPDGHAVYKELFNSYTRPVGHMDMPPPEYPERFKAVQEAYDFHDVIPSLAQTDFYPEISGAGLGEIGRAQRLDSEGAKSVYRKARAYLARLRPSHGG